MADPHHRNDLGFTVTIVTYQGRVSGIGNTPDMRRVCEIVLGDKSPRLRFCRGAYALSESYLSTGLMGVDGGARL